MYKILIVCLFLWLFSFVHASDPCVVITNQIPEATDGETVIFQVNVDTNPPCFPLKNHNIQSPAWSPIDEGETSGLENLQILGTPLINNHNKELIIAIEGKLSSKDVVCNNFEVCDGELAVRFAYGYRRVFPFKFQTCTATINSVNTLGNGYSPGGVIPVEKYGQEIEVDITFGDACLKNKDLVLYSFHTDILQSKASQLVSGQKSESVITNS